MYLGVQAVARGHESRVRLQVLAGKSVFSRMVGKSTALSVRAQSSSALNNTDIMVNSSAREVRQCRCGSLLLLQPKAVDREYARRPPAQSLTRQAGGLPMPNPKPFSANHGHLRRPTRSLFPFLRQETELSTQSTRTLLTLLHSSRRILYDDERTHPHAGDNRDR